MMASGYGCMPVRSGKAQIFVLTPCRLVLGKMLPLAAVCIVIYIKIYEEYPVLTMLQLVNRAFELDRPVTLKYSTSL